MARKVKRINEGETKIEGAGVEVTRLLGKPDARDFDPFLMLDVFDHDDPKKYSKGFLWHPHRGIETVTYLLEGEIEHRDSLGNTGVITDGDCQWMTAGSGIIHQEMPRVKPRLFGLQLWINLPARDKMTPPKYRYIRNMEIPVIEEGDTKVHVIAGKYGAAQGPIKDMAVKPVFLDVSINPDGTFSDTTNSQDTLFLCLIRGSIVLEDEGKEVTSKKAVLFDTGDELNIKAGENGTQFLLISGKQLKEPIAWSGSVVMNTQEELQQAYDEIDKGSFIK